MKKLKRKPNNRTIALLLLIVALLAGLYVVNFQTVTTDSQAKVQTISCPSGSNPDLLNLCPVDKVTSKVVLHGYSTPINCCPLSLLSALRDKANSFCRIQTGYDIAYCSGFDNICASDYIPSFECGTGYMRTCCIPNLNARITPLPTPTTPSIEEKSEKNTSKRESLIEQQIANSSAAFAAVTSDGYRVNINAGKKYRAYSIIKLVYSIYILHYNRLDNLSNADKNELFLILKQSKNNYAFLESFIGKNNGNGSFIDWMQKTLGMTDISYDYSFGHYLVSAQDMLKAVFAIDNESILRNEERNFIKNALDARGQNSNAGRLSKTMAYINELNTRQHVIENTIFAYSKSGTGDVSSPPIEYHDVGAIQIGNKTIVFVYLDKLNSTLDFNLADMREKDILVQLIQNMNSR